MAWATRLPSKRYRAMYRDGDGKQHSVGTFPTKAAALLAADHAEKLARNDPDSLRAVTLEEFLPVWRGQRSVQPSTALADESKLTGRVIPRWGTTALAEVAKPDVQAWVADMVREGLAASTIQKTVNLLSSIMRLALEKGMIPAGARGEAAANPCKGVTIPRPAPSPERYLSRIEAEAIRALLRGFDRLVFDVLIGTGARWGEAVALSWDTVNLDQRTIEIAIAYDRADKSLKATKGHAKRVVPIGDSLAESLRLRLAESGFGAPPPLRCVRVPAPRSALVLGNASGLPYDAALFAKRLDAAARAATVEVQGQARTVGHVRVHDLRHTFASWLVQASVPLQQVQRLLGHRSIATTERYARLSDSGWDAVRTVLG